MGYFAGVYLASSPPRSLPVNLSYPMTELADSRFAGVNSSPVQRLAVHWPDRASAGEAAAQATAPPAAPAGPRPLPAVCRRGRMPNAVIVHSATTIETKRSAFGTSGITPAESALHRATTCAAAGRLDRRQPRCLAGVPSRAFATRAC